MGEDVVMTSIDRRTSPVRTNQSSMGSPRWADTDIAPVRIWIHHNSFINCQVEIDK